MKILILGGTQFIGIHLVAAARARGHEVTVFNRGNTPLVDADGIEQITGDRHRDLVVELGAEADDEVRGDHVEREDPQVDEDRPPHPPEAAARRRGRGRGRLRVHRASCERRSATRRSRWAAPR